MKNPCTPIENCPYKLTEEQKVNMCSNPDNTTCKYLLKYQGYTQAKERPALLPYVEKWGKDEDSIHQLPILTYELGDLARGLIYMKRYPDKADGYRGEAKLGMADLLAQCIVLCEREGWDFDEILELGIEHCIEKITRYGELGE